MARSTRCKSGMHAGIERSRRTAALSAAATIITTLPTLTRARARSLVRAATASASTVATTGVKVDWKLCLDRTTLGYRGEC